MRDYFLSGLLLYAWRENGGDCLEGEIRIDGAWGSDGGVWSLEFEFVVG